MSLLEKMDGPEAVQGLCLEQLPQLAEEIRERIITTTSRNGGHIGPNLGVVELTLALHRVFQTPKDRFVFDVSHQGYVHKLLTGRNGEDFDKLRQSGGVSGFLARGESEHDSYGAGHAGTALSAAMGMAAGRDARGSDEHVVAILGDAALTCGITMEALNNVGHSCRRLIVILNDNEWSISKNVGAMARYLNNLITNPLYTRIHADLKDLLHRIPGGDSIRKSVSRAKMEAKDLLVPSSLFEHFGLRYLGPIEGHDLGQLIDYLEFCRNWDGPILLHVLTQKGKGYDAALKNPEKFHGIGAFDRSSGKTEPARPDTAPKYQDVFGQSIVREAKASKRVVGITAAMPSGTGLSQLAEACPEQFHDVGIAEEHAVLFAAGLATQDLHPVCGIYSTFLQRAVDPVIHDIALQNLPVTFCMDRAGIAAQDGPTHHGLFDIALFRCVPNTVIMQPKDENELSHMIHTCVQHEGPSFIRYPRGQGFGVPIDEQPRKLELGKAERLSEGVDLQLWALGPFVREAEKIADEIERETGLRVGVTNARFVKPLDDVMLHEDASRVRLLVSLEDHAVQGGFGSAMLESLADAGLSTPLQRIGWPDTFISHGSSTADLRKKHGLDNASIKRAILERWEALEGATDFVR